MILDQGRRHDDSPSRVIAVKEIENTSSFCRLTRRHLEPIALDQIFNGELDAVFQVGTHVFQGFQ